VPSVDDLANAIRAAIDRTRDLLAGLGASREQSAEFRDELGALGFEARAARAAAVGDRLEETQVAAAMIAAKLESALAATEAARTGTTGGKGGTGGKASSGGEAPPKPTPTAPPPEPPSGWNSASDLVAARDNMPHLGNVTPGRRVHILDGDGDGESGGHRWDSEIPDKTKFPYGWSDDKIIREIGDVARTPDKTPTARRRGGWICEGTRDGVTIEVVINRDGQVWTGYPLRGRGVEKNPGEW
jgi:hypothetical protein